MKKCSKCKENKTLISFYANKSKKDGYHTECKDCVKIISKEYYSINKEKMKEKSKEFHRKNPDKQKATKLKQNFGMTIEQKTNILLAQNNCCAICKCNIFIYMDKFNREFAVDHDHKTGQIRGLLCHNCNMSLGKMQDSSDLLRNAANYLDHYTHSLTNGSNVVPFKGNK